MATTTNFGWETPDDTDLVKDGALAMRTLGNAIDTSLVDLKGGTTDQVLAKNSNTDMDFKWVTSDDANAIQNAIVDAKGDLISATAADTPARLAVGTTNGQVLIVDSSESTGLRWQTQAISRNVIHNSNFQVAQRGTSFTSTGSANNDDTYQLDRWYLLSDGNDAVDVTQATDAPTNGLNSIGLDVETINKKFGIAQIIEQKDSIGLIGNTVTLSFAAKVSSTTKLDNVKAAIVAWSGTADVVTSDIISAWGAEGTNPTLIANATYENSPANLNVTTSWARYSVSAAIDTASTKNILVFIWSDVTDTTLGDFLYVTDVQLELGAVATPYFPAGRSFNEELSTCQRYYVRFNDPTNSRGNIGSAIRYSNTNALALVYLPVTMRSAPSAIEWANLETSDVEAANQTLTTITLASTYATNKTLGLDVAFGGNFTAYRPYFLRQGNNTAGFLGVIAEL